MLFGLLLMTLLPLPAASGAPAADTTLGRLPYYPEPIHRVDVDGRALAYYDGGGDGAPVLFVHGLGSNLSFWRENLAAFEAAGYRVLAVDLPGYGLSGKDDVPGTMAFFAETLAGFLDALGLARVHYVGVSMGGQIGLTLALAHPERLRSLTLASPAGIETFSDAAAAQMKALVTAEAIASTPPAMYQATLQRNFARWDERFAWLAEQRGAVQARADFGAYAEANARSVAGMLDGPVFDRLGAVDVPALVLFGTGDQLIPNRFVNPGTPADVARVAGERLPRAQVQMVEDAGHLLMLERPAAFDAAVLAFLEAR